MVRPKEPQATAYPKESKMQAKNNTYASLPTPPPPSPYDDLEAQSSAHRHPTPWSAYIRGGDLHTHVAQDLRLLGAIIVFFLGGSFLLMIPLIAVHFAAQCMHAFVNGRTLVSLDMRTYLMPAQHTPVVAAVTILLELLAYGWWLLLGLFGYRGRSAWFKFPVYHFFARYLETMDYLFFQSLSRAIIS